MTVIPSASTRAIEELLQGQGLGLLENAYSGEANSIYIVHYPRQFAKKQKHAKMGPRVLCFN